MSVSSGTSRVIASVASRASGVPAEVRAITMASFSRASCASSTRFFVLPVWEISTTTSPSLQFIQLMRCSTISSEYTTGTLKRKNLFIASWATAAEEPNPKKAIFFAWVSKSTARLMADLSSEWRTWSSVAIADSNIFPVYDSTLSSSLTLRLT